MENNKMCYVNYAIKFKNDTIHHNNYVDDIKADAPRGHCINCIFVGKNDYLSLNSLCAETMTEVAELSNDFGHCDKLKSCYKWYNQINPIKKRLLEKSGFVFKNR